MYQEIIRLDLLERPALGEFSPSRDTLQAALSCLDENWKPPEAGSSWELQKPFILATIGKIAAGLQLPHDPLSLDLVNNNFYKDHISQRLQAAAVKCLFKNKEFEILAEVVDLWQAEPERHKITANLRFSCKYAQDLLENESLTAFELNQLVRFLKNIFLGVPEETESGIPRGSRGYEEPLDLIKVLPARMAQELCLDILREIKSDNVHYKLISERVLNKLLKLNSEGNLLGYAKTEEFLNIAASMVIPLFFSEHMDFSTGIPVESPLKNLAIKGKPFTQVFSEFLKNSCLSAEERVEQLIQVSYFQKIQAFKFCMEHDIHYLPEAYEALKQIKGRINDISFDSLYYSDFHNDDEYRQKIEHSSHILLGHIALKEELDDADLKIIGSVLSFDANLAEDYCFLSQLSKKAFDIYLDKFPDKLVAELNSYPGHYLPLLALITMHNPVLSDRLFSLNGLDARLETCLAWGVPEKSINYSKAQVTKRGFFCSDESYNSITQEAHNEICFLAPWLYKQDIVNLSSISSGAFSDSKFRLSLSKALDRNKIQLAGIIKILDWAAKIPGSDVSPYLRDLTKIQTGDIKSLLPFRLSPKGLSKVINDRENTPTPGAITAVILQAPSDHNGAFHQLEDNFPQLFTQDVHTLFFNPEDLGSLNERVKQLKIERPDGVDILLIEHHGMRISCQWGEYSGFSLFTAILLANNFNCRHLIINSCSAFKGGGQRINLANAYSLGMQLNSSSSLGTNSAYIYAPIEPAALSAVLIKTGENLIVETKGQYLKKNVVPLSSRISLEFVVGKLCWFLGYLRASISSGNSLVIERQ